MNNKQLQESLQKYLNRFNEAEALPYQDFLKMLKKHGHNADDAPVFYAGYEFVTKNKPISDKKGFVNFLVAKVNDRARKPLDGQSLSKEEALDLYFGPNTNSMDDEGDINMLVTETNFWDELEKVTGIDQYAATEAIESFFNKNHNAIYQEAKRKLNIR